MFRRGELPHHRPQVGGHGGKLPTSVDLDLEFPRPLPHLGQRPTNPVEIPERPAGDQPSCAQPDQAGVTRGERHEQGVVARDEHKRGKQGDRGPQLHRHQRRERSELTAHPVLT